MVEKLKAGLANVKEKLVDMKESYENWDDHKKGFIEGFISCMIIASLFWPL